jgi:hypothetical protein
METELKRPSQVSGSSVSGCPASDRKTKFFDFFEGAPHIVPLSKSDDAEILEFFDQAGMSGGGFRLLMQRKPKFFDLFDHRGGISRVVGLRDDKGRLVGTGAITTTPCFIDSKPGNFVYLADLRVQVRNAALIREWRDWFGKVMKEAPHFEEAGENGRMVCAIIETNARARRVLEERVHNGQKLLRIAPYSMVTLLARRPIWPRLTKKKGNLKCERGGSLTEIEGFLESVNREQAFGQCFAYPHFELRRRLQTWKGFSLGDFFTVRDSNGKIIAATALWNPNQCKQSVVEGPGWTKGFNFLAGKLGWPRFGEPLEIIYLTHLAFAWELGQAEKREILGLMMEMIWPEKKRRKAQAIAFCDFKESSLSEGLHGFLKANVSVGMYLVLPEAEAKSFEPASLGRFPPAFEMVLV